MESTKPTGAVPGFSGALPFTELKDEEAILNFIFDPSKSFIGGAPAPKADSPADVERAQREDPLWAQHVKFTDEERRAVAAAEAGDLEAAGVILDRLCNVDCPDRASSFNNRAQLGRLKSNKDSEEAQEAIKADLDTAVRLANEWLVAHPESEESAPVVGPTRRKLRTFHKRVLQQAHTQRALYYKSKGKLDAELRELNAAANAGSALAQAVATGTNPFATLCNDTVAMMLRAQGLGKKGEEAAGCAKEKDASSS